MTRVLVLCLALFALAACSGEKQAASPPAPSVLSDQQQALQKAEALRTQHAEQRKAELDAQMEKAEGGQ